MDSQELFESMLIKAINDNPDVKNAILDQVYTNRSQPSTKVYVKESLSSPNGNIEALAGGVFPALYYMSGGGWSEDAVIIDAGGCRACIMESDLVVVEGSLMNLPEWNNGINW